MNKKSIILLTITVSALIYGCGGGEQKSVTDETPNPVGVETKPAADASAAKGIGKFQNVELTHPLDEKMVTAGSAIYDLKCSSCHKLTDEKLVGPGWKGVTDRRTPEWIMNFITNTSVMLDSDLVAQKMFVTCLVRMPSQGLTDDESRQILEFMRKNDGKN
jgi:mono/diheme cytochrome c family protein